MCPRVCLPLTRLRVGPQVLLEWQHVMLTALLLNEVHCFTVLQMIAEGVPLAIILLHYAPKWMEGMGKMDQGAPPVQGRRLRPPTVCAPSRLSRRRRRRPQMAT